jgi:hypothetical protein
VNPEYGAQGVNLSHFSFKTPAPARQDCVGKHAKTDQNDGLHRESSKPLLTAFCLYCLPVLLGNWSVLLFVVVVDVIKLIMKLLQ